MTHIKTFIGACLLVVGLLSSCNGTTPNLPPAFTYINFRIVDLTPEIIPTKDLHVEVQKVESGQYFEIAEYNIDNNILLRIGARTFPSPQPPVDEPGPWSREEEPFETNLLVYHGEKLIGSIKAEMKTTKFNYNRVTRLISYTGFQSVELVLPPHPKDDADAFWYSDSFKVKL